jgi:hypothetical protein
VTVIFQGSHRGAEKGCGRRAGCVGVAAKVYGRSELWRAGIAQEEKEWWSRGKRCAVAAKARGWRGILRCGAPNEGSGRVGIRGKSGECGRMLKEANGLGNAGQKEAR